MEPTDGPLGPLRTAADAFDWVGVHTLCAGYVEHLRQREDPPPSYQFEPVLKLLREHRRYEDLVAVADALLGFGVNEGLVGRSLAQSLVDRGAPATARLVFEQLADQAVEGSHDWSEARGGIARCTKELFLTATAPHRRRDHLRRAYTLYRQVYDQDPERHYWHGINAAAMAARAARDGVSLTHLGTQGPAVDDTAAEGRPDDTAAEARRLVETIVTSLRRLPPDPWIGPTLVEACSASGRHEEALDRARVLVEDPATTAFALNALLRQLTDVWQLDSARPPGAALVPILEAGLLARSGGDVVLDPDELTRDRLVASRENPLPEKVFGADRYRSLPWYRAGLQCCRAVARIEGPLHTPVGTGALLSAADLGLDLPGPVVLTNAHVVPDAVPADEATVTFHALRADGVRWQFGVQQRVPFDDDGRLDTSVLLLDGVPDGVEPLTVAPRLPNLTARTPQRAYVIGHPHGWDEPQFSLQDNGILDHDDTHLHYRSPTDRGSSGSPVFDNSWRLIGLHHAGSATTPRLHGRGGFYPANEAIVMSAIRAVIAGRG